MRTLVLGSAGFIAGSLVRHFKFTGVPYRAVGARELDLTLPHSSSTLAGMLSDVDSLVICSALTPERGRDPLTFDRNVAMIEHVSSALLSAPRVQVVYLSSDAAEDPASDDLYGQAHLIRERTLRNVCNPAIIRPCAVYGAGDTHNAYGPNRFVRSALATGIIHLFGEGEELRDHLSIDDLLEIIVYCLRHSITGCVNAATGSPISFRSVADVIVDALPGEISVESLPRLRSIIPGRSGNRLSGDAFPDLRLTHPEPGIRDFARRVHLHKVVGDQVTDTHGAIFNLTEVV